MPDIQVHFPNKKIPTSLLSYWNMERKSVLSYIELENIMCNETRLSPNFMKVNHTRHTGTFPKHTKQENYL